MAIFRSVQMSFWTDVKVADDFTPDDRLMYLYLLTNPHTNLAGCYEVSTKQISLETGFDTKKVKKLLKRFDQDLDVIRYSEATREILILKWHKYNWTQSEKFRKPLLDEINKVKDAEFIRYLTELYNGMDTVSIPYGYGSDTTVTVTDTVTDTITDTVSNNNNNNKYIKHYYPQDEKLDKAFSEYVSMRKNIHKPMTDRAIELAMKKLDGLSHGDPEISIAILEQSIFNSWSGLFELKKPRSRSGTDWDALMADIERREAAAT